MKGFERFFMLAPRPFANGHPAGMSALGAGLGQGPPHSTRHIKLCLGFRLKICDFGGKEKIDGV
ncbi:hypothetical protein [Azospirillum soli]|uniref:hypothetical protein n=1 Tax=Azospirillum soli TaxID=1304799 RepID=UPI001AE27BE8|nr:hypothetical protein [Azospirillum soli]MBP2315310.1 hypothetical protein [Azospirillum soli]